MADASRIALNIDAGLFGAGLFQIYRSMSIEPTPIHILKIKKSETTGKQIVVSDAMRLVTDIQVFSERTKSAINCDCNFEWHPEYCMSVRKLSDPPTSKFSTLAGLESSLSKIIDEELESLVTCVSDKENDPENTSCLKVVSDSEV